MLQLRNISKDYIAGDTIVHALKEVNICFRRNEFVSILGQSGCGKTTMLILLVVSTTIQAVTLLLMESQLRNSRIETGIHIEIILLALFFRAITLFPIRLYYQMLN